MTRNWPDYDILMTKPSKHVTSKDVYAVTVDGKASALCISCAVRATGPVEYARSKDDDVVLRRKCQGCGLRQGRLI